MNESNSQFKQKLCSSQIQDQKIILKVIRNNFKQFISQIRRKHWPVFLRKNHDLNKRIYLLELIKFIYKQMQDGENHAPVHQDPHGPNRTKFAILIILTEILIIVMYGIFVRIEPHDDTEYNQTYYPMYQDVNVMMLIGFGFLMTFIKRHSWSALSYTFFINAIVVQLYILLSAFWERVFHDGWEQEKIQIREKTFTAASYSVASVLIAFGAVLGRVGPLQLLIMSYFGIVGYTLNESIVYGIMKIKDVGGSTAIHTFGAYFGLTVSWVLARKIKPQKNVEGSYVNSTFAMIGTLFLWMFWPSFNAGYFPENGFQRSLIISNTIISLTGSCLSTFIVSALVRDKFSMDDILNATLAGGVIIGAPAGVVINPGLALFFGLLGGVVSTLGFFKLGDFVKEKCGIFDTCGVHNLHAIPGVLGGIISGIVIAGYRSDDAIFPAYRQYLSVVDGDRSYSRQGGMQVGATFVSMGIAIGFGLLAGLIISCLYKFTNENFFEDKYYFEVPDEEIVVQADESPLQRKKLPPIMNKDAPSQIVLDVK